MSTVRTHYVRLATANSVLLQPSRPRSQTESPPRLQQEAPDAAAPGPLERMRVVHLEHGEPEQVDPRRDPRADHRRAIARRGREVQHRRALLRPRSTRINEPVSYTHLT